MSTPSSAQPMPGLSRRAQELLKPKPLRQQPPPNEPAGYALTQQHKRKAQI